MQKMPTKSGTMFDYVIFYMSSITNFQLLKFFFSKKFFLNCLLQDTYTLHYLHSGMKQTTTYITLHYITMPTQER